MSAVSIVVPVCNEEEAVGSTVEEIIKVMEATHITFELIVVDDGSTDRTVATIPQHDRLTLIRHPQNRGYGAALKTGIRRAQFPWVAIIDADGTYPVQALPDLLRAMEDSDMVIGARVGAQCAVPWIRRPAKWAIGRLANFVAGRPIPDVNSGLRVFRRQVALHLFNLLPEGFSFTITITLAMLSNGYLVDYVPINYYARVGRSKIHPIQDTLNFVQVILRIALYFAPLKIFLPLSGMLMLLALAWGVFSWSVLGRLADVSTLVIVMTAVQMAVVGLLAELINRRLPNYYRLEE